jgi:beta-lactamase regulating signal transducer with metallopeptidase domain
LLPIHLAGKPMTVLVIAAWAILSSLLLIRLMRAFASVSRLKSRAMPAPKALQSRLNRLASDAGVERRARLLVCDDVAPPMALGLFDPAILLPASMPQRLSEADFDHVALHELAHLQRYDDWMNFLQKLIEALFPIQPAVFWISRQLTLERETACDDWVIAARGHASGYASTLTRVAELTLWARSGLLASGAAGNPSQLYRRVQRVLDPRRNIRPRASAMLLLLGVMAIVVLGSACAHSPQVVALADMPATTAAGEGGPGSSAPTAADAHAGGQSGTLPAQAGKQKRNFPVELNDKLKVEVDRGEVSVGTSADTREARITVTQKGRDIAEFLKHHTITIEKSSHEVRVHAWADRSMPSNISDVQISYRIDLPTQFNVDISNSLGEVAVSDLKGKLAARVSLGELQMSKIDGPLNAQLSQGRIEAVDCTGGALQANVSAGEIVVRHFTGPSIEATASSGSVSVEFARAPTSNCSISTSMGEVSARIPASAAINIEAATSMGSIQSDLALQSQQRGQTGVKLQGSLNGGGPTLKLAASMGSIQISKQ